MTKKRSFDDFIQESIKICQLCNCKTEENIKFNCGHYFHKNCLLKHKEPVTTDNNCILCIDTFNKTKNIFLNIITTCFYFHNDPLYELDQEFIDTFNNFPNNI